MTQIEREKKLQQAEEELIRAKNKLARVKKETKEALRKEQNHHKYMMGGAVSKYFPILSYENIINGQKIDRR